MNNKIPLILVTGFLGSGKTSFLDNFLSCYSNSRRVAVLQNEFAQSSIDADILKNNNHDFILREINRGSIFCSCLFSSFKDVLIELSSDEDIDIAVVEMTGIADPIALAQIMDDKRISDSYYLQKIITVVDAVRFIDVLENITGVRHQIEVADLILVNKTDLLDSAKLQQVVSTVKSINPIACIRATTFGAFDSKDIFNSIVNLSSMTKGELTKCGQGNYVSRIFKTNQPISMDSVDVFLNSMDNDILRVKGYVTDKNDVSYMIQYIPDQTEIFRCAQSVGRTELISIGFKEPDFGLLKI